MLDATQVSAWTENYVTEPLPFVKHDKRRVSTG